jgi:uncharacterized phiE125 gp8 family phage protein
MPLVATGSATFDAVSVADLKAHLRIDDADQDAYLTALRDAALEYCEAQVQRRYRRQGFRWVATSWPRVLVLPVAPVDRATVVVKYRNAALTELTLSAASYVVVAITGGGARIVLKNGFSWPDLGEHEEAVSIEFQAGYAAADQIPPLVKHAIRTYVAQLFLETEGGAKANDPSTPNTVAAMLMPEHWFE